MRRLPLAIGLLALLLPASAAAQSRVFQDYRDDGQINPCDYSPGELRRGLSGLPPDVEAYVPGLNDQLRRGCGGGGSAAAGGQAPTAEQEDAVVPSDSGPAPPPAGRPRADVPDPPALKADARNVVAGTAPTVPGGPLPDIPAWLAALLAAALAGGLAAAIAVRYGALDPSGLARSLRAALARR